MRDCGAATSAATTTTPDAAFAAAYPDQRFTVFSVLGDEVELVPGGRDIRVTLANRLRFVDAALHWRLHEFDAQVGAQGPGRGRCGQGHSLFLPPAAQLAAMRRGLATMVPVRALSLFTWQEVEVLVAGKPDVDM